MTAQIIMNPGTGPVVGASYEEAIKNIDVLLQDAEIEGAWEHFAEHDKDGRFYFLVERPDGNSSEIEMPGLPLERVRYLGTGDQNIWDFPRLYINGSSWVWKYAVNILRQSDNSED